MIEGLDRIVATHPLFASLGAEFIATLTGCAKNVRFHPGDYLLHEGQEADQLFLIREGLVALEIGAPGHGRMTFQTSSRNGVVGLTGFVPPFRWTYDARAVEETRALSFDTVCLRRKCDADPALGFAVMQKFMPVIVDRLHATRLQLLDVYGAHGKP